MAQEPETQEQRREGTSLGPSEYQFASGVAITRPERMVYIDFYQWNPHERGQQTGIARIVILPELAVQLAEQLSKMRLSDAS